jgi:hypothetical protein
MRAHIVENGVVVNTIEVDSLDAIPGLIDGDIGGIGWLWDGVNLTPPAPDIDAQWAVIRTERNKRLTDCDWWVIKAVEAGLPITADQSAYRQELRDITTQADPFAIVWPESPPA